ncbi:MAG: hypothetical protein HY369_04285 [Candidatus Aenigmarchaeota archaeon]|nr:hypothetical protein [Candidatus Aenigmarchaeota archaeon]
MRGFISPQGVVHDLKTGAEYEHHVFVCSLYGEDADALVRHWRREPLDAVYERARRDGWIRIGEVPQVGQVRVACVEARREALEGTPWEAVVRVVRALCPDVVDLDLRGDSEEESTFLWVRPSDFYARRFVDRNPPINLTPFPEDGTP